MRPRIGRGHDTLGSPEARKALDALHDHPVTFPPDEPPDTSGGGWQIDDYRQPLPGEPPGPPVVGGTWEAARRLVRDYEFADPRMVRAVYYPDEPLEGRDMLLVARFFGLRFHLGVRVGGVVDGQRTVDGRTVRVWGWDYRTLRGHLEAGRMDYEVWKWLDSGEIEFRIRRVVRTARITNPVVRLGWAVFGRWMQVRFVRRACERMVDLVDREAGGTRRAPVRAAETVAAAPASARPRTRRRWRRLTRG